MAPVKGDEDAALAAIARAADPPSADVDPIPALRRAFDEINSYKLRPSTVLMDEETFEDIKNAVTCQECGAMYDRREGGHPGPECDLEKVRQVTEA